MRRSRLITALATVVTFTAVTACTATTPGADGAGTDTGPVERAAGSTTAGGTTGPDAASTSATGAAASADDNTAGSAAAGTAGDSAGSTTDAGQQGPGVTDSTITLMYRGYNTNTKEQSGPVADAIVDAYNEQGGIAGRTIELVPMSFPDADPTATSAEQAQAQCLQITESDQPVFALISDPANADLDRCLNDRGVAVLLGANFLVPEQMLAEAPFTAGFSVSDTHAAQAMVDVLQEQDYLDGASTIGVVDAAADPYATAVTEVLIPGIEKSAQGATVNRYTLAESADGGSAAASSLVLRMRADGVDRVVIFGEYPGLSTLGEQLVSQKFTPRLAQLGNFVSNGPKAMGLQNASADMLNGVVSFFWDATAGTPQQQEQWRQQSAAAGRCLDILRAANLPTSDITLFIALPLCEGLDLLAASLGDTEGQVITAQDFVDGLAGLDGFEPITTFSADFSNRRDGDASYKLLSYRADCQCFAYAGDPRPLGSAS